MNLAAKTLICGHCTQNAACNGAFCKIVIGDCTKKSATKRAQTGAVGIDRAIASCKDDKNGECREGFEHVLLPLFRIVAWVRHRFHA